MNLLSEFRPIDHLHHFTSQFRIGSIERLYKQQPDRMYTRLLLSMFIRSFPLLNSIYSSTRSDAFACIVQFFNPFIINSFSMVNNYTPSAIIIIVLGHFVNKSQQKWAMTTPTQQRNSERETETERTNESKNKKNQEFLKSPKLTWTKGSNVVFFLDSFYRVFFLTIFQNDNEATDEDDEK